MITAGRIRKLLAACLVPAAVAVGACGGGDTDEAATVARDFLEAHEARDGEAACALLTDAAIEEWAPDYDEDPQVEDCVDAIESTPNYDETEIGEVSVVDETEGGAVIVHAYTDSDPEPTVMVAVESDGEWLLEDTSYDSATEPEIE